jgi:hypothetical protein
VADPNPTLGSTPRSTSIPSNTISQKAKKMAAALTSLAIHRIRTCLIHRCHLPEYRADI